MGYNFELQSPKMNYETYWSILDSPSKSMRSYDVFLWLIIITLACWILIKKFKKSDRDIEKTILLWLTGITLLISLSAFIYLKLYDNDESYKNTERLLMSERVGKIEGVISNFERGNIAGRRGVSYESFTVDSIDFHYSDELLGRFNHFGKADNWIFQDGLPVRITYGKENNEILKIEIAKSDYNP